MSETILLALIPTLIPAVLSYLTVRIQTASKKATDELNQKINNIQSVVEEITEIGKRNNSDIGALNTDISNLKNEVSDLNKDIKNLKSDVKQLKKMWGSLAGGF